MLTNYSLSISSSFPLFKAFISSDTTIIIVKHIWVELISLLVRNISIGS